MKTEYEYIRFEKIAEKAKTSVWSCLNSHYDTELGRVKWYPQWRRYCYFPTVAAVYSEECINDISDFIHQLNEDHKRGK